MLDAHSRRRDGSLTMELKVKREELKAITTFNSSLFKSEVNSRNWLPLSAGNAHQAFFGGRGVRLLLQQLQQGTPLGRTHTQHIQTSRLRQCQLQLLVIAGRGQALLLHQGAEGVEQLQHRCLALRALHFYRGLAARYRVAEGVYTQASC